MYYEETEMYRRIQDSNQTIYIYGAGVAAQATTEILKSVFPELSINNYIVSDTAQNPSQFLGVDVIKYDDNRIDHSLLVILAFGHYYREEVEKILDENGFKNYLPAIWFDSTISDDDLVEYPYYKTTGNVFPNPVNEEDYKKAKIYRVTSVYNLHKAPKNDYDSPFVSYIQAGKALTDTKMCDICDDDGDSISIDNKQFCELTAGYWMWKNDHYHEYVGLYHYGRKLELSDSDLCMIMQSGIDAVITIPSVTPTEICWRMKKRILQCLRVAVERLFPDYLEVNDAFWTGNKYSPFNMIFAKKEVYDVYYTWLMSVLFETRREYEKTEPLQDRTLAWLGELLESVYFAKHDELNVKMVRPVILC